MILKNEAELRYKIDKCFNQFEELKESELNSPMSYHKVYSRINYPVIPIRSAASYFNIFKSPHAFGVVVDICEYKMELHLINPDKNLYLVARFNERICEKPQ